MEQRLYCSVCDVLFIPTYMQRRGLSKGGLVSCGRTCRRVLRSLAMTDTNLKYASARMGKHNPMANPASVQKMQRSLQGRTPSKRGGNGTGLSPAEQALSAGTGLKPYVVPTRTKRSEGYPTHYKLDLANPECLLAVEVDGRSHRAILRQKQDQRKEDFLKALGWTILRFTNEQALKETNQCCDLIKKSNSMLCSKTTSRVQHNNS
jgi:hypothetical protein